MSEHAAGLPRFARNDTRPGERPQKSVETDKPFDNASLKSYIMDEDNAMKQFTTSEAKKLLKDILAEKKQRAEYFKANGTLKGFVPAK